jgi:histidyl-tRNA synthetase
VEQRIEATARENFRRAGTVEIRTPLLEVTELLAHGISEVTYVVGKEMYTTREMHRMSWGSFCMPHWLSCLS